MTQDLYFHYKNVGRFLLIQKAYCSNSYRIPLVKKIIIFFSIKNVVDLDDLRSSNYIFLFKMFFGRRFFISSYCTRFHLNVLYHSWNVQNICRGRGMFFPINFLINDIMPVINREFLHVKFFKNCVKFSILDMNIFLEKKNAVGFFNLKEPLNYKFFFFGINFSGEYLLLVLKLI